MGATMAVALAQGVGCSDSTGPGGIDATFALREDFVPFEMVPPLDPPVGMPGRADTLVFRADGTGERRMVLFFGRWNEPPTDTLRSVSQFEYERDGDEWTLETRMACLPSCDIQRPPPVKLTMRGGVLYMDVLGIEYPFEPVG